MADNVGSANIEWKQDKDIDKKTRASRRLDMKKLALADENSLNVADISINRVKKANPGLKKIRSKIKEVFDEDEEEDEIFPATTFDFEMETKESSLLAGLKEDEKRKMQAEQTIKNQDMEQAAGKMTAIMQANRQMKELGLKQMDAEVINKNMLSAFTDKQTFNETVKQHIERKEKINTKKIESYKDTKDLLKGLQKIRQAGLTTKEIDKNRIEKLEANELKELGKETNDKKAAKTILKKTGRQDKSAKNVSPKEQDNTKRKLQETMRQQQQQFQRSDYERN